MGLKRGWLIAHDCFEIDMLDICCMQVFDGNAKLVSDAQCSASGSMSYTPFNRVTSVLSAEVSSFAASSNSVLD